MPKRHTLTPAEWDVVARLIRGATYLEVAEVLGIARQTVKNHVTNAMRKYETTNVRELGYALGWVHIGPRPEV